MEQTNGAITPDVALGTLTVGQLQALAAPVGKVTKEQALEAINRRRAKKGVAPLDRLP